jgi:hypothetical protein
MSAEAVNSWRLEPIWLDGRVLSRDEEELWGGSCAKERGEDLEWSLEVVAVSRDMQIIVSRQLACSLKREKWGELRSLVWVGAFK